MTTYVALCEQPDILKDRFAHVPLQNPDPSPVPTHALALWFVCWGLGLAAAAPLSVLQLCLRLRGAAHADEHQSRD